MHGSFLALFLFFSKATPPTLPSLTNYVNSILSNDLPLPRWSTSAGSTATANPVVAIGLSPTLNLTHELTLASGSQRVAAFSKADGRSLARTGLLRMNMVVVGGTKISPRSPLRQISGECGLSFGHDEVPGDAVEENYSRRSKGMKRESLNGSRGVMSWKCLPTRVVYVVVSFLRNSWRFIPEITGRLLPHERSIPCWNQPSLEVIRIDTASNRWY